MRLEFNRLPRESGLMLLNGRDLSRSSICENTYGSLFRINKKEQGFSKLSGLSVNKRPDPCTLVCVGKEEKKAQEKNSACKYW